MNFPKKLSAPTYKNYAPPYSLSHEEDQFFKCFRILMFSGNAKNTCELLKAMIIVSNNGGSTRFFKPGTRQQADLHLIS